MITMHPSRRGPSRMRAIAFSFFMLIAALDQAAKAAARARLESPVDLTPFLALRLGFNPGVTFGLFADSGAVGRWALSAVAFLIIGVLLTWIWRTRSAVTAVAASLIAGGALGNLLDRLRSGAVTDFIDLHWGDAHWPTFNLADAAIVCGVALLLLTVRGRTAARRRRPWDGRRDDLFRRTEGDRRPFGVGDSHHRCGGGVSLAMAFATSPGRRAGHGDS